MNCAVCQASYQPEDKFCPGCGGSLAIKPNRENACKMCDAEISEGVQYCQRCGSAVGTFSQPEPTEPVGLKSETPGNVVTSVGCLGVIGAILIGCSAVDANPRHDAAFVAISYMLISVFVFGVIFIVGAIMRIDTKRTNRQRGFGSGESSSQINKENK